MMLMKSVRMNSFIGKVKYLNRKRNLATTRLKIRLRMISHDNYMRKKTLLRPSEIKTIIIMMIGKGIGDAIVMTGLIKVLHDYGYRVSVIAEARNSGILQHLPFVEHFYLFKNNHEDQLMLSAIKQEEYDLLIDIENIDHHSLTRLNIIKYCSPEHTLGINQFARIYDTSLNHPKSRQHVSARHIAVAHALQLPVNTIDYFVDVNEQSMHDAQAFAKQHGNQKIIVINPYGTEETRNMSFAQINTLCALCNDTFNAKPFIIGLQSQIAQIPDDGRHIRFSLPDFEQAAAIVKLADVVISTDTSIVHLCRAFNKKLVCIYNNKISLNGEDNNTLWGPDYDNAVQLLSPGKRVDETSAVEIFNAASRLLIS